MRENLQLSCFEESRGLSVTGWREDVGPRNFGTSILRSRDCSRAEPPLCNAAWAIFYLSIQGKIIEDSFEPRTQLIQLSSWECCECWCLAK